MKTKNSLLTVKEKSLFIKVKSRDYVPDPRGLGYVLHHSMLQNATSLAQIDVETGNSDTYASLLRRCVRTSINLLSKGITKDDIICQCSGNHLNSCVPLVCALFLGARMVLLDPSLSLDTMTRLLNQVRPRIIFVSLEAVEVIKKALEKDVECEIVVFGETEEHTDFESFLNPENDENCFEPSPITDISETAVILYSGRELKGICLSHYTLMTQTLNSEEYWNFGNNYQKEPIIMSFETYYWITAILILICSTKIGATRVICSNFEASNVWRSLDHYNISFMHCATFQAVQLYKSEKPEGVDGKSLKMLVTTGTSLSKSILLELRKLLPQCFITNAYIQAEVGGAVTMFSFCKPVDIRDQYEKPTSCGRLLPGITCKIVDPITGKILGLNQAGGMYYKVDFIKNDYHKKDSRMSLFDNTAWIKTNDIAFYDERSCFHVLDPYEDVFKCKCWHVVPSILENVIKEHVAVKEVAVIGIPYENKDLGEKPMAVVRLNRFMTNRVTVEDIEQYANKILSKKQKLRSGVKFVKKILVTPLGRPNRQEIKKAIINNKF